MPEPREVTEIKENSSNREYVLKAVSTNGKLLEYADDNLKNDKEVVLTAIENNPEALEFASDLLKKDREIVYKSVSEVRLDLLLC